MAFNRNDMLMYYTTSGRITDLSGQAKLLDDLPDDLPGLCGVVQNALLHIFWAERMGYPLMEERKQEVNVRHAAYKLAQIHDRKPGSLMAERTLPEHQVGNCRDFAVLMCAILRHKGIPARARCGFGTYFWPDSYEDHWVVEYWNRAEERWALVDAQLDSLQCQVLKIDFDPLDVPRDRFLTAGVAWKMIRQDGVHPNLFGIFEYRGLGFVRRNLLGDLAALNKVELLPWDFWGLSLQDVSAMKEGDRALLDRVAELSTGGDENFDAMRALYESEERLRVPDVVFAIPGQSKPIQVDLSDPCS